MIYFGVKTSPLIYESMIVLASPVINDISLTPDDSIKLSTQLILHHKLKPQFSVPSVFLTAELVASIQKVQNDM